MSALLEAAKEVCEWVDGQRLASCVIGGLAVQRWGEPRLTRDDLVESPQGVVGEEAVVAGPGEAALAIAAVQGPREEHVLGADDDSVALRVEVPIVVGVAAHDDVNADAIASIETSPGIEKVHTLEPATDGRLGLAHQRAHGKAEDESARRRLSDGGGGESTPVQPAQGYRRRLPRPRGRHQD